MPSSIIRLAVFLVATLTVLSSAMAQSDTYHITATEKAACTYDAQRLCSDTYPDETRLLSCMQANRSELTRVCRVVFDAGVKRRHLAQR